VRALVLLLILASGCHYYRMEDRIIAQLVPLSKEKRKDVAAPAVRLDGQKVLLRGDGFHTVMPDRPGTHLVRMKIDDALIVGLTMLGTGIAAVAVAGGLQGANGSSESTIGLFTVGGAFAVVGGVLSLVGSGRRSGEYRPEQPIGRITE
jgi:hypothetical protein